MSYIDQITVGSTTYDIQDSTVPSWAKASAAPVLSVNNKTGVVSLSATDVGAYSKPSTGIPASDIASGVIPIAATAAPVMDGTATVGTSTKYAREDHRHPVDTSRAAATHTHSTQQLYRPSGLRGANDVTLQPLINTTRANRLAFLPADQIIIEKTTDGGTTWVDAGISDSTKVALFSETRPGGVNLPLINGVRNLLCGLRITITAMKYNVPAGTTETQKYNYWNSGYINKQERYCQLKEFYFWLSTSNDSMSVKIERATGANPNSWQVCFEDSSYYMIGWSGCDYVKLSYQSTFGGGTTQTGNHWNYRLTFMTKGKDGTDTMNTGFETQTQSLMEIRGYGDTWWGKPNEYMANDKIYTHDASQNVTFPSKITAPSFVGALTGNASTATKATQDESGNNIKSSYGASLGLSGSVLTLKNKNSAALSSVTLPAAPVTSVNNKTGAVVLTASDVGALPTTTSIPAAYTATPAALGTASAGSSPSWARGDHVHAKPTYSKSDVGLGNVDNVKQYSASNPPPYPVTSVNGSTGAVSVNAVPTGGTYGQVLTKGSSGYSWKDAGLPVIYIEVVWNNETQQWEFYTLYPWNRYDDIANLYEELNNGCSVVLVDNDDFATVSDYTAPANFYYLTKVWVTEHSTFDDWWQNVHLLFSLVDDTNGTKKLKTFELVSRAAQYMGLNNETVSVTYSEQEFGGGGGLPSGGSANQFLKKNSSTDGDASWASINQVPTGGSEGQVLAKTSSGYGWVDVASALTFTVENENLSILQI